MMNSSSLNRGAGLELRSVHHQPDAEIMSVEIAPRSQNFRKYHT